jgi:hypothetical protein
MFFSSFVSAQKEKDTRSLGTPTVFSNVLMARMNFAQSRLNSDSSLLVGVALRPALQHRPSPRTKSSAQTPIRVRHRQS